MVRRRQGLRRFARVMWLLLLGPCLVNLDAASARAQVMQVSPGPYVGNRNSKIFHAPNCSALSRTSPNSMVDVPNARAAAANGFRPCQICKPTGVVVGFAMQTTSAPSQDPSPVVAEPAPAADDGELKFSRDIAPILVGNCIGCHNPRDKGRRNNLDLTTFNALRAGGDSGPLHVAGKPEESEIVRRIKGQGVPKMPPGQRDLAPETIARIEQWIAAGGTLDAGIDPAAELSRYAPSAGEMRRAELAGLAPEERDQRVEQAGLDRWKKAISEPPVVSSSGQFMLFSNLPEKRSEALLKAMNAQLSSLGSLLGPAGEGPLGGPAKLSLYVFKDRVAYAEFVRSNESREVDPTAEAHGNLGAEMPYLVAVDPLLGAEEDGARGRGALSPDRSLAGLLSEQLGSEAARNAGSPPRWMVLGLGAYLAQRIEPSSPYFNGLRRQAVDVAARGGLPRARELLGGRGEEEQIRALGFSLLEWLGSAYRTSFTPFVRAMLEEGSRFDDVIQQGFGARSDQFLGTWGNWAIARYGRRR